MADKNEKTTLTLLRADQLTAENMIAFAEKLTGEKCSPEGRAKFEKLAAKIAADKEAKGL
jgi:hypothetical protein